nr:hypothetical protein GCM10010200_054040 [Actinomadura rugatobispora]
MTPPLHLVDNDEPAGTGLADFVRPHPHNIDAEQHVLEDC